VRRTRTTHEHSTQTSTSTVLVLALPALSLAVVPPSSHLVPEPSSARPSPSRTRRGETSRKNKRLTFLTSLLPPPGGGVEVHDEEGIVPSSVAVGVLTAALGFAYGKVLDATLGLVWRELPRWLDGAVPPALFVTAVCTAGGLVVGILSSVFDEAFTVADFVSALSKAPVEALPSSR